MNYSGYTLGFASTPSNYGFLQKARQSKNVALKPCKYVKESTKLRNYQAIGCVHLLSLNRMILGDSPGLGKTPQGIVSYSYLLQANPALKLLVITPKSARNQWAEEIDKFTQGISVHILTNEYGKAGNRYAPINVLKAEGVPYKIIRGFDARKIQYDTVTASVLITSYFSVQEDYTFLIQNRSPSYVVMFDEAQEFKNHKTKTWFGANEIAKNATRVYGLSATIIKNRLEEAYNIFNVVVPGLFGGRNKFLQEFTIRKKMTIFRKGKKQRFNKIVGYQNLIKFKELIDPFFLIRKTREVAAELPKLISKRVLLEMSDRQDALYKEALSGDLYRRLARARYFSFKEKFDSSSEHTDKDYEMMESLQFKYDESLTTEGLQKNKIAGLAYCQMISNGPGWLGEDGESSKEQEFERIFEQELAHEKVIVFTRFKSGIPRLEKILDKLELKHVKITGDVDDEGRKAARLAFQDPANDTDIIFITYAGSAALNLQAANIILFYDTPWSYGDLYQTIGRAQRIGSLFEHIHLIHFINSKTIDEHVIKILEGKKDLINNVMGDIAEGAIDFKEDEMLLKDDESSIDALYASVFGQVA